MVFLQVCLPTLGIFWHPFHPLDRFADIQELITKFDFEQVAIYKMESLSLNLIASSLQKLLDDVGLLSL